MVAQPHRLSMSVEAYLELDRNSAEARYEFIDGRVYMLARGAANHSSISIHLISLLDNALRGKTCIVYNSDLRVKISETRYVYPDVTVSCDARDQEDGELDILQYPVVIIEVLSPSTEAYDRGKKFAYYRTCPILQEYALASSQEQPVEVYRRATNNVRVLHLFGPGEEVELKSLNIRIPIASIYENISFPEDVP